MALYFGKDMLKTYKGTVFHDAIESLLSKIKATLPSAYTDTLDRIRRRLDAGPAPRKDYTPFAPTITALNRAIMDEKKIHLDYFSMGRQTKSRRTVHPYQLRHVEDTLYLIGYCTLRKAVRTFAVHRIQSVTVTGETFQLPESFDLKGFLQDSFGIYHGPPVTVRIRFLESVAGYIRERVWHPSQHLSDQPDGSIIFTATVAGIEEISHWVLRWGAGAQVLDPDELRQTISRHASAHGDVLSTRPTTKYTEDLLTPPFFHTHIPSMENTMQDLTLALIQAKQVWEDTDANLNLFQKKIDQIETGVHLIVLPEMFTTGFTMHPQHLAQRMDGPCHCLDEGLFTEKTGGYHRQYDHCGKGVATIIV